MKNIELASINQIDLIMKIIKACTRHMIDNGIFQWNDKYPTKQSFIDDINNNDLFVLKLENKIIGCVCASFDMDEFYKQIVWETSSKKLTTIYHFKKLQLIVIFLVKFTIQLPL